MAKVPGSTSNPKVIVVMPAYNAELTVEKTFSDLPPGSVDEVILVDDCSKDRTVEVARGLGIHVIERDRNGGYGANQKMCYDEALSRGADIVVMVHPDYQYDSTLVPFFTGFVWRGTCDVMLGSRVRTRREVLDGGMPVYKYLSNRFLTLLENVFLGQNLGDFHSGFRVYRREVLETIPYHSNSDDFVFDSQILAQATFFGFKIGDAPVPVRYFEEASSINLRRSLVYGTLTVATLLRFWLHKLSIARSRIFERSQAPEGDPVPASEGRIQTS
jgi:glycosyltransferase involved in cell wall biosynthesis